MIAYIEGKLVDLEPLKVVIDAGGVGYAIHAPITTTERLPKLGSPLKLFTLPVYRDSAQTLYGFIDKDDLNCFQLLIEKVSGVGPRLALGLLSKMNASALQQAIAREDKALLAQCPGLGKKTAERIVVELRDKISPVSSGQIHHKGTNANSNTEDAIAALLALGYKPAEADKAVRQALEKLGEKATTQNLIRAAFS